MGDPNFKPDETSVVRLPRVSVDFKIPIWALGGALAGAVLAILNMSVTLTNVAEKMTVMQATLNNVVEINRQLIQEQAMLKYRIDKLEATGHTGGRP